jgi:hypothetical protein
MEQMQIKGIELNMETIGIIVSVIGFIYQIARMESKIEDSIESVNRKLELHIEEVAGDRKMIEYKMTAITEQVKEIVSCLHGKEK